MSDYMVGIDFGASSVKVVALNGERLMPLTLNTNINEGRKELVNFIHYGLTRKGDIQKTAGSRARNFEITESENTVSWIKRKLLLPDWSKTIDNLNREITAWEAAQDVLGIVKGKIDETAGEVDAIRAMLTVPVNFSTLQRRHFKKIVENCGLIVERIITEPFAAIFSLDDIDALKDQLIFVFDFGASTLDVSVSKIDTSDGLRVKELSAAGLNLGGIDIDEAIAEKIIKPKYKSELEEFLNELAAKIGDHDNARNRLDAELMRCARELKEEMFGDDNDEPENNIDRIDMSITRDEVIEMFRRENYEGRIVGMLDRLFFELSGSDECLDREDVTMILPFGGTSHIDYFTDILAEYFGDKFDAGAFSFEDTGDLRDGLDDRYMAVAGGAAACLKLLNGGGKVEIENIIPFRLGYEWKNRFVACIDKNSPRGVESKKMPLEIAEMEARGWKLDIYQSFGAEGMALDLVEGSDAGAVYIGTVEPDKDCFEPNEDILVRLKITAADKLQLRFYQLQRLDSGETEVAECQEILFSIGD